jgi:hypothetical protein
MLCCNMWQWHHGRQWSLAITQLHVAVTCCVPRSLALKVHREALLAMRGFWETLMHSQVPFRTLAACIKNMDVSIRTADRVYK